MKVNNPDLSHLTLSVRASIIINTINHDVNAERIFIEPVGHSLVLFLLFILILIINE